MFNSSIKYNAIGEVIEKTDSQNNTHSPIYDIAGRVKQINLKKQGENIKTYVSDVSYNPKGQRTSITYGNGVVTSYSYDPKTFRLTKLESVKEQKKLQSINYTYDPIGNITTMDDESYKAIFPNNKTIDTKSDYHYDSLYRLIEATGKEHPALSGKEEVITPIPHLNNQNAISNYTEYYDFDYGSNITKIRHNGGNNSTKEFYISNKSNRSLPIIDSRSVSENDIDASYDESGNLLKLNGSQDLHWNYRDNIAYVDIIIRPSGKNDSEYYVYDSSGQRVRKVTETYQNNETNSTRVEKIYFGDLEVTRTYQESDLKKEKYTLHVADDKSRVALHHYWTRGTPDETRNSQSRYQLSNHLDSVALELNDNAEIMSYEEYLPFGGTALIAGKTVREVTEKEYRYSGKERDDTTGLYYYGMRYYAPWLARWINPDPAGTVDGLNLYQFVGGNPVKHIDNGGTAIRQVTTAPCSMAHVGESPVQYTTGVEKVEINTNNPVLKQRDFSKRNYQPDPKLVDNRMVSENTIFILDKDNKVKGITASFTTKSGLYVKDKGNNYYHFPSSLRSTMHSDILQGRANQYVNENRNIVAVNFKAGTGNSFSELMDNQITQPGSIGGLFQRDAEAAGLEIIEEKKLVKDGGKNQLLFLNINQSSCDDCSAALRAFADKYPDLKFSFSFGSKYANDNRNNKFSLFLQDYKSRVFDPISGVSNSISVFDQSIFSGKGPQVYEKTDKKGRSKLKRYEKENQKNNYKHYK